MLSFYIGKVLVNESRMPLKKGEVLSCQSGVDVPQECHINGNDVGCASTVCCNVSTETKEELCGKFRTLIFYI